VKRHTQVFVAALSVAVVAAFALAAWSFASSHSQSCHSRNTTLNVLRDVIVIATTPPPNDQLTPDQRRRLDRFKSTVFARINNARC
jgi:hypothetical protein